MTVQGFGFQTCSVSATSFDPLRFQASYFIFEKMKQEGYAGNEDVRLRTAIHVPKAMVGRVIGKGGKNVSVF